MDKNQPKEAEQRRGSVATAAVLGFKDPEGRHASKKPSAKVTDVQARWEAFTPGGRAAVGH